jgi:hypothetical protein
MNGDRSAAVAGVMGAERAARAATIAPLVCAAHCAATPVLVVVAPWLTLPAALEAGLMGVALVVAGAVLVAGTRSHGRRRVWLPAVAGAALWLAALTGAAPGAWEVAAGVAGGGALAAGLLWSGRLAARRRCGCGTCED